MNLWKFGKEVYIVRLCYGKEVRERYNLLCGILLKGEKYEIFVEIKDNYRD